MGTRRTIKFSVKVKEGDWFAIPLTSGGYGLGIVARAGRGGVLFGYFFGPRRELMPTLDDVRGLRAVDAVFCEKFGHLGIQRGEWPFLGRLDTWDRAAWPLPEFARIDETAGRAWLDRYNEDDVSEFLEERRCSVDEARRHPTSGLSGSKALEIWLTKKLSEPSPQLH